MSLKDDMNNPLEQLKVEQALRSEYMKMEYRKKTRPDQVNILDYTVIAALEKQLQKKPENIKNIDFRGSLRTSFKSADCPSCGAYIDTDDDMKLCTECGQAIDWSVEE